MEFSLPSICDFFTAGLAHAFRSDLPVVNHRGMEKIDFTHKLKFVRDTLALFLTPEQAKILLEGNEEGPVRIDLSALSTGSELFPRLELTPEQKEDIPLLLLYLLTAREHNSYGERSHLQVLISAVINHQSHSCQLEAFAVMDFLRVAVKVGGGPYLFHSQVFVQTCLALVTSYSPMQWINDENVMLISNRFHTTMDYNFPQAPMIQVAHGGRLEYADVLATYIIAYLGNTYVTPSDLKDETWYLRPVLEKLELLTVLEKRASIDALLGRLNCVLTRDETLVAPLEKMIDEMIDNEKKRKRKEAEESDRETKKARKEV